MTWKASEPLKQGSGRGDAMKDAGTDGIQKWAQAFVVVVLAAALGVTTSLLMDARRRIAALEKQPPAAHASNDGNRDDAAHEDAVAPEVAVSAQVQDLRARVQRLEARAPALPEAATGGVPDDLAAALGGPVVADRAEGTGVLGLAVQQELDRREDARTGERDARAHARLVEKLDALDKTAKLSAEQKLKLTTMLDAEQQEIRQLFRDARDSGDFATVREQVRVLRAHTDENALAVLEDDQKTAYANMREEERSRFLGLGGAREER
jgi:hypothetical protein